MGFEQRIQERRFRALLETLDGAIARRDAVAARAALDEARELKPAAPELDAYMVRLNAIPVAPPAAAMRLTLSRAFGAVAMLLVGVSLLTGIDYLRSLPEPATVASLESNLTPALPSAAAEVEEPALPSPPTQSVSMGTLEVAQSEPFDPEPLGTVGVASRDEELVAPLVPTRPIPAAANAFVDEPLTVPTTRETPDDYVARSVAVEPLPRTPRSLPEAAPPAPPALPAAAIVQQPVRQPAPFPLQPTVPAATATPAVVTRPQDESRVASVLSAYARAYRDLDAGAARAVWPTVNERALARAFASLDSQNVSFDDCQIQLHGATANASCRGRASYVGKVGSREPRIEARLWQFQLRRDGEEWKIENAEARRQ